MIGGKNISSRVYSIIRASIMACLIPAFFIYILLNKPDYKLMNAMRGVVVPVAGFVGDVVSWPIKATGRLIKNIRNYSLVMEENRELRAKLDFALRDKAACDIFALENQRLTGILGLAAEIPKQTIIANVTHDLSALNHSNFILNKGKSAGIGTGMAVLSTNGFLAGVVTNVTDGQSMVRALSDSKSNIPVRVAGTDVYGFLRGSGRGTAVFEFFSDPEFTPTPGTKLISSNIKGTLPNGIPIGSIKSVSKSAYVELGAKPDAIIEVMVLSFDARNGYK